LQPQGVAAVAGAHERDGALVVLDQPGAPQDEGAHDDLADVGLGHDHAVELFARDPQDAGLSLGAARDEDLAVVEEVELASELRSPCVVKTLGSPSSPWSKISTSPARRRKKSTERWPCSKEERPVADGLLAAVGGHARGHLGREARERSAPRGRRGPRGRAERRAGARDR
jgi:hypothetical protein